MFTESAYRQNEDDVDFVKIPVHPISYADVLQLMKLVWCNHLKPFKPSRCIKASFYIPEHRLNFPMGF